MKAFLNWKQVRKAALFVNDLFRYFHNMKGNSGIIGYNELNALTHEAETLLNNVRQGKLSPSRELVDLLLLAVDTMEGLVQRIDVAGGSATPVDIDPLLKAAARSGNRGRNRVARGFYKSKSPRRQPPSRPRKNQLLPKSRSYSRISFLPARKTAMLKSFVLQLPSKWKLSAQAFQPCARMGRTRIPLTQFIVA